MKWRSIILNGYAGHPPMFEGDGTQGGAGTTAPIVSDSQATPVVETNSDNIGPMRFGELNRIDNPIYKALNDVGQETPPATDPGTDPNVTNEPPVTQPPQQTDTLTSVMEQIKQINPKAAEKYNSPEAIAKVIINQEKTLTNLFQEKAQLKTELDNLKEEKNKVPQTPEPPPAPEPTPEELEEMKSKELELMMEDPFKYKETILELAQKRALDEFRKEFKPVKDSFEAEQNSKEMEDMTNNLVESFITATNENGELLYPDFEALAQQMSEEIKANPDWLEDGPKNLPLVLKLAYRTVKGKSVDPSQLVNDENFVNNYILNNKELTQKIAQNYVQAVKSGQPPVVISGQPGGASPASPIDKPGDIKSAGKAMRKFYGW